MGHLGGHLERSRGFLLTVVTILKFLIIIKQKDLHSNFAQWSAINSVAVLTHITWEMAEELGNPQEERPNHLQIWEKTKAAALPSQGQNQSTGL
jgi:hypothetical protein